ncbi:MAG: ATP-binding protein [Sphingopyxis sp.]|uniref:sensor histidine kinase n=1 Tax=Sphingopyxis sp. TaxID=1908224 RepID=UPI002AB86CFB|nr:ATP-binding protein [Sphingopyxis sp.]MDZ3832728.1 ATP-binding protein [Sphingopyxis sp.]
MTGFDLRPSRLKLAPRIGLAILLTVCAAYFLNQALRYLIPPPPFLIVQRDWLVDAVADGVRAAERARQGGEGDASTLRRLPAARQLDFEWVQADFGAGHRPSHLEEGLRRAIAEALSVPRDRVRVMSKIYDQNYTERTVRTAVVIVPELPTMLTADTLASNESSVLGDLSIWVRIGKGRWLTVTPRNVDAPWRHYARVGVGVAGYLLIVILLSIWIARSIVLPLNRLAAAAERLGRNREPTPIGPMYLPEHAAIADTFDTMQMRLKRFIDERMGMLAAISHDLRTPLTRLRLMAEYVGHADQREQLLQNVNEMETMIGDTLAFMNEEARRERVEDADVAALLISLTDEYGDFGHSVSYQGPDHADLPCRPLALKRAFSNLIINGCQYGGAVRIRLCVTGAALVIDIHDAGQGIAPDQEVRAFRPFERLEMSRNRETGGSGLGLSICRDIVSGHGGEISFHRPGDGFIVRVVLPRPPLSGR